MKKTYMPPKIDVFAADFSDIITASLDFLTADHHAGGTSAVQAAENWNDALTSHL